MVKLSATDADEDNHLNSKIAYKIISQEPAGAPMFMVNRYTGEVRTMSNFLDREVKPSVNGNREFGFEKININYLCITLVQCTGGKEKYLNQF